MFTAKQEERFQRMIDDHLTEQDILQQLSRSRAICRTTDGWVANHSWAGEHHPEYQIRNEPLCEICGERHYDTIAAHPWGQWEMGREYMRICNTCDSRIAQIIEDYLAYS
jgi:hypothetical protein